MRRSKPSRRQGMTVVELLIAVGIGLFIAGIILQVLTLTMRTTAQTSARTNAQGLARTALVGWEEQLRDGYAILTTYTLHSGPGAGTTYTTKITDEEQTVVAAVPSIDKNGVPCAWRGINVVFDCLIWHAARVTNAEGVPTWRLYRLTIPNAFQMPDEYLTLQDPPRADPFFSLVCGQFLHDGAGSSSSGGATYEIPAEFGRESELSPRLLFEEAADLSVELRHDDGTLASRSGDAVPPTVNANALPVWVNADGTRSSTHVTVTDVSVVDVRLDYAESSPMLNLGPGTTTQTDTQSVSIRLRNKPTW